MSASPESSREESHSPMEAGQYVTIYEPAGDDWDDDDMEFEPASETTDDTQGESDLDDSPFHDAAENLDGYEIHFEEVTDDSREESEDPSGDNEEGEETEREEEPQPRRAQGRPITITQHQILQLLGQAGLRGLFANHGVARGDRRTVDEDDDDESTYMGYGAWPRRSRRKTKNRGPGYPPVPNEEGRQLMESGTFGTIDRGYGYYGRMRSSDGKRRQRKKLAYNAMMREVGLGSAGRRTSVNPLMKHYLIPSSKADLIINYNSRAYSGQFSDDGNFFFSCAQDFRVRMYDTSNPYRWKYYKTVHYLGGQWTITDATLSPDNKFLAYSSIRSQVCLAPTDPDNTADPYLLEFSNMGQERGLHSYRHFGIWSLRFSGDGREIVAGTGDSSVYVYDLETRQSILRIHGHDEDVNAVCFGDVNSPHILYSGSDDTTLKVWDRRSMGDGRAAGVFLGHTEGLTYIDSKGDGRYVLSNAKDQTMKLWDLRKMIGTDKAEKIDPADYTTGFDYRFSPYDEDEHEAHPHDCSLVTFRGHKVLKTLIRCHFSPPGSTDGRYVYSGSRDGNVYIWNLDATLAGKIDVLSATKNSRPVEDERLVDQWDFDRGGSRWDTIVRDASWHPNAPVLAATSWNGWSHGLGTCTVHSWNDGMDDDEAEPKMGARVTAQLEHDERYYGGSGQNMSQFRRTRLRNRAQMLDDDDD